MFAVPTAARLSSTTSVFACIMLGVYSKMRTPASSSSWKYDRAAQVTVRESLRRGTSSSTSTPRSAAVVSAVSIASSGTK